jgi:hypothetical protein
MYKYDLEMKRDQLNALQSRMKSERQMMATLNDLLDPRVKAVSSSYSDLTFSYCFFPPLPCRMPEQ